jgi:hypothetical protein
MKRNNFFMGMFFLTFIGTLCLTGCFTPPAIVYPGEALDAIGVNRATELQFLSGSSINLVLMRTKNGQPDTTATIRNGQPSYTRQSVYIPFQTKGVVIQRSTTEDGRLMLGVAFEEDQNKLLWFIQTTSEVAPFSRYVLLLDEESTENHGIVKYGDSYYWVQNGANAELGIIENFKVNSQTVRGRKL